MKPSPNRAAVIDDYGALPTIVEHTPSSDGARLELRAAALNPADLAIASGSFPAGSPPLPYVPGIDGVGVVLESERFAAGTRVGILGSGVGVARDGTWADRFSVPDAALLPLPDGVEDTVAAALLTPGLAAWLALTHAAGLREGESVLVLGAGGAVGTVAVQAARILGAGRVVAVARDPQRVERRTVQHPDVVVPADAEPLVDAVREAVGDNPPNVVVDPVFGPAFEAALVAAAPEARVIHIGQSAAPTVSLGSGLLRGKRLSIQGLSVFFVPRSELEAAAIALLEGAVKGLIALDDVRTVPLERAADAWAAKRGGEAAKLVITP
jgi:NADPH:quinone reductase-like Zn-dependent oxidoreductase